MSAESVAKLFDLTGQARADYRWFKRHWLGLLATAC